MPENSPIGTDERQSGRQACNKSNNDGRGRSAAAEAAPSEKRIASPALSCGFRGRNRDAAALSSGFFQDVQRFITRGAAQRDLWPLFLSVRAGKTARLL